MWICRMWRCDWEGWRSEFETCDSRQEATRAGEIFMNLTPDDERREYEVYFLD